MDFNEIKYIIDRIERSSLTEFELKLGNDYIKIGKNGNGATQDAPPKTTEPAVNVSPTTILPDEAPPVLEGTYVKSPIVGTYYASPSPNSPPFVKAGDAVKKGDVLCVVEAMKVMNEITSEHDGRIAEVCAVNEQMVEYGQSLFRIVEN